MQNVFDQTFFYCLQFVYKYIWILICDVVIASLSPPFRYMYFQCTEIAADET